MLNKEMVLEKLKEVIDPELRENIVDLNLVYDIEIEDANVKLKFRPTTKYCPIAIQLGIAIKKKLQEIKEIDTLDVTITDYIDNEYANKILKQF